MKATNHSLKRKRNAADIYYININLISVYVFIDILFQTNILFDRILCRDTTKDKKIKINLTLNCEPVGKSIADMD